MNCPGPVMRRIVVSGMLLLGLGGFLACLGQLRPVGTDSQVVLEIAGGESFSEVARRLHAHRLIKNEWMFVWMGRLGGLDRNIIQGEYALHGGMWPVTILGKITRGDVTFYTVTIPEGFSSQQIADLLYENQLVEDPLDYMRLTVDLDFIRTLSLPVDDLEGYLFPDTYRFPRHMEPERIIQTMVARFRQIVTEEDDARARALGFTMYQVLTLASVIEKETAMAEERALISGVFHNRLRQNIPLQSDPTVIYSFHEFDGNLRKKDLLRDSPYNTYHVTGLPYGPIANPGAASIRAALYPANTDYLYFVSRNDGSHEFSATLAEHRNAVEKYQLRPHRRSS